MYACKHSHSHVLLLLQLSKNGLCPGTDWKLSTPSRTAKLLSSWRMIQQWRHLRSTIQKTSNNLQTMTSSWFLMLQLALKTKRSCVSKLAKTWQVGRYWCCHMKRRWMRCFTSRCWRVAEDMGLSTFPWAEYFRRYEDYASKWGIAPVTGSDAWLYKSAPPIHWAFGLLWSGPDPVGLVLAEVRNRSPFYPLKAEWWTKCNRNRTGVIIRDSVRHNKL